MAFPVKHDFFFKVFFLNKISICVIEPEIPEVGYTSDTTKLHDAGYDAYITSSVFVNLCNLFGKFLYNS